MTDQATPTIPPSLLEHLNVEQTQAVSTLSGPLLILAGPGSGKTKVLTHRIAALLATGTPASQILALTFTNKAAGEMRQRLTTLLGGQTRLPWAGTFHAACARILRPAAPLVGLPSGFAIAATDDSRRVLRQVITQRSATAPEPAEVRQLATQISKTKNRLGSLDDVYTETFGERSAEFAHAYQAEMLRLGQVDFDDLLLFTRTLLHDHVEVRDRLRQRITHLLVDEYQDTNNVQYDIVRSLDGHGNVCVVGDADQAIYGFRSASAGVVDRFREDYPQRSEVRLGQNYRSSEPIVALASAVIAAPTGAPATIWTDRTGGDAPSLHTFATDRDEARFVVEQIAALGSDADVAVLMRTNSQSRPLEERLTAASIPYDVVGSLRFYDRAEIRDALAWCRLAVSSDDVLALTRAAGVPRRGLGPAALEQLRHLADTHGLSVRDALVTGPVAGWFEGRHQGVLTQFADDVNTVIAAAAHGPVVLLEQVYRVGLRAHHAKGEGGADRVANLDELAAAARDIDQGAGSVTRWLEHVALLGAADDTESKRVRLMTVHAAKGREFDHVFIIGVEEGLFPHALSKTVGEIDEERRLLYVAITRARHQLTLSHCVSRFRFNQQTPSSVSRFVTGLPSPVLRRYGTRVNLLTHPPSPAVNLPRRSRPGWQRQVPTSTSTPSGASRSGQTSAAGQRHAQPRPSATVPPGPRVAASELSVGHRVVHRSFGPGVVVAVNGSRVEVNFGGKHRTLDVEIAPLELG